MQLRFAGERFEHVELLDQADELIAAHDAVGLEPQKCAYAHHLYDLSRRWCNYVHVKPAMRWVPAEAITALSKASLAKAAGELLGR